MEDNSDREYKRLQIDAQKIANTNEKVKSLSVLSNVHNLNPPSRDSDNSDSQIAIVKALEVTPRLQELFLEARGLILNIKTKLPVQISKPYMNVDGAWRLVQVCKHIAQEAEWSNFEQDKIPEYIEHFYCENLPYFTFWNEDYDLSPNDFNYVMTTLKMFILASFYKAKNAKYLNTLGRTYSEDFLGRVMGPQDKSSRRENILSKLNPFRKMEI